MNVKNAKKLLEQIKDHGREHFDMDSWYCVDEEGEAYVPLTCYASVDVSECGTTACMAGHTLRAMVDDVDTSVEYWAQLRGMDVNEEADAVAAEWLGIRDHRQFAGECPLFYISQWNEYGDIGETAQDISLDIGEYEAAIFLLENLIDRQERGVPLREELTKEEINRQDQVDRKIQELISSLIPRADAFCIEDVGKVRDALTRIAKDYGYTEHEFYPYI